MKSGARLGLAIAAGYFLGRFHKLKWALAVAAMAGRGRVPGAGGVLQQGAKLLTSSPELTQLTDEMRGRLVEAGKTAAVAAVSSKINSLSDGLRERSDAMRAAGTGATGKAEGEEADGEEDVEYERHRHEDRRRRDEDRVTDSRRRRHPDEDDGGRVPPPRGPVSRREADRGHDGSRLVRRREGPAARGRAGQSSRRSGEGSGARNDVGVRQRQDDGRSRPRSSASRTGGDSE